MITQAGEYALRAIMYLGCEDTDKPSTASQIASATKVPLAYLQKILRKLTQKQLLVAHRGIRGGFVLAKLPAAISVLDVLKACDSAPQRVERCPLGNSGHAHLCALHKLIDQQTASAERIFAVTSIEDLLNDQSAIGPMCEVSSETSVTLQIDARNGSPKAPDKSE
jgi:Rrf2 family protein